ncbi:MAG: RDD family protein, partial [Actinomycetota bacterium]|nr:RDD family protein [Actinomycetota bacterium]
MDELGSSRDAPSEGLSTRPEHPDWAAQGPSGPRASFGRRLVAYLIDAILLGIVYVVVAAIFDQAVGIGLS